MSYHGLPSGFIPFNTIAHKILVLLYEQDKLCLEDFKEEKLGTSAAICAALKTLVRYKYIYKCSIIVIKTGRPQKLYTLKPVRFRNEYKPMTQSEKDKRYKERKKETQIIINSVFKWHRKII